MNFYVIWVDPVMAPHIANSIDVKANSGGFYFAVELSCLDEEWSESAF